MIVSYDGRGVVTLHYPNVARASAELRAGGAVPLDHSFELDDAPLFERRTSLPLLGIEDELRQAEDDGLIERCGPRIAPSDRGRRFLNRLLERFLVERG